MSRSLLSPVLSDVSFYQFWFACSPSALRDFFCSMTGVPKGRLLRLELLPVADSSSIPGEGALHVRYRLEGEPVCTWNVYFAASSLPPLPRLLPACLSRRPCRRSFLFIEPRLPKLSLPCYYSEGFTENGTLLRVFSPKSFSDLASFPLKTSSLAFWCALFLLPSPLGLSSLSRRFPQQKELLRSFRDALSFFPGAGAENTGSRQSAYYPVSAFFQP